MPEPRERGLPKSPFEKGHFRALHFHGCRRSLQWRNSRFRNPFGFGISRSCAATPGYVAVQISAVNSFCNKRHASFPAGPCTGPDGRTYGQWKKYPIHHEKETSGVKNIFEECVCCARNNTPYKLHQQQTDTLNLTKMMIVPPHTTHTLRDIFSVAGKYTTKTGSRKERTWRQICIQTNWPSWIHQMDHGSFMYNTECLPFCVIFYYIYIPLFAIIYKQVNTT